MVASALRFPLSSRTQTHQRLTPARWPHRARSVSALPTRSRPRNSVRKILNACICESNQMRSNMVDLQWCNSVAVFGTRLSFASYFSRRILCFTFLHIVAPLCRQSCSRRVGRAGVAGRRGWFHARIRIRIFVIVLFIVRVRVERFDRRRPDQSHCRQLRPIISESIHSHISDARFFLGHAFL
jgi:hypothetical protein